MDYSQARNIIVGMVVDVWDSSLPIEYPNKILKPLPSADQSWGRLTVFHDEFKQSTVSDSSRKKRYDRKGNFILQIFTKLNNGLSDSDLISQSFVDNFEGATDESGEIWFKNAQIREVGETDAHYQVNFICNFSYTHIK
jgi:hypothetical protein